MWTTRKQRENEICFKEVGMIVVGGIAGVAKLAAASACLAGAWMAWKQLPESKVRTMMHKCFQAGDLYLVQKVKKGERKVFPTINRVSIYTDRMQVNFSLPHGLDPKEVLNHEWAFRQVFGDNIDIEGDSKYFTLSIYPKPIEQFLYDYEQLLEHVDVHKLPIVAGSSRSGIIVYDMVLHPHLLITGETGSGKSTQLRSILTFLMQNKTPEQLHFYMADLKMSEFHLFKRVPHVKANEVNPKRVQSMLLKIEAEMKERGQLLNDHEEAHIDDLPEEVKPPYIVVCIDEFALLKSETKIMNLIDEISSIGRTLGVFLILSCLRPDAKVMEGNLKNNLTVRMAFRASNAINSRISIDVAGAEQIKQSQKGLMLLKYDGLHLVQAPYLELKKAKTTLEPLKEKKKDAPEGPGNTEELGEIQSNEQGPDSADPLPPVEGPDLPSEQSTEKIAKRQIHSSRHKPKEVSILPVPDLID